MIKRIPFELDLKDHSKKPRPENAPSNLGAIGRYVLTPDIFAHLKDTKPGHGGEIQLTDALRLLDQPIGLTTRCTRFDIGDKLGWMKSSIELTLQRDEFSGELRAFLKTLLANETILQSGGSP